LKTLLSLFDFTGNWSRPYAENGWNVILWDIKHTCDLYSTFSDINVACAEYFYENIFDNYGTVDGILAAVPCTDFAGSGARWWKYKDESGSTEKSIELVYQTLRIIDLCMPDFWAIENPVGRISKLVPELGKPWYFQPYWFGEPYTKKTGLFGNFKKPKPTNIVEPIEGSMMWKKYGGKSEKTKEMRSITPKGFANAFFKYNH
jgi:site-specific DNA-cytosine methylase